MKRARQRGFASSGRKETSKSLRGRRLIHEKAKKKASDDVKRD